MYTAWLSFGDSCKDVFFPDHENWNVKIVLGQEETGWQYDVSISIRMLDGHMYMMPDRPLVWKNSDRNRECEVSPNVVLNICDGRTNRMLTVIIKQWDRNWLCFDKYVMKRGRLLVGRSEQADIRDTSSVISSEHGTLSMDEHDRIEYRDHSVNGTYLNGRKMCGNAVHAVRLGYGDILSFTSGMKIVCLGTYIAINRMPSIRQVRLEKRKAQTPPARMEDELQTNVCIEYQRAPRMLAKCELEDVEIEPPIPKQGQAQGPLILQLGPSMTMVLPMLMGTVVASGGSHLISSGLVMISTSSLLAVMWGLANRSYRKKQERIAENRRRELYQQYIQEMEAELKENVAREYHRLSENYPNAAQCAALPSDQTHRLWNRMPAHPDFLHVRVGTGTVKMPYEISIPKQKLSIIDDELRNEPGRLKQTYSTIADAPMILSLREEPVIGILGDIQATLFAQGMLMQIAALHSYHDVRIVVLTEEPSASQWSWARWLPHVFANEDRDLRMVASTPGDIHDVVSYLDEVVTIRKNSARRDDEEDAGKQADMPLPHYVVFCTSYRILESEPAMRSLLTNHFGMTLVMTASTLSNLPKECSCVLDIHGNKGTMHSCAGDTEAVEFEYPDRTCIKSFSKQMAPLRVRDVAENAAIPTLVSFLDIYNVRRVENLDVWRMWSENHTYDGLKSVIGYRAGSQPFVLDISDKYHGPHGLIAGTTGSGKSVMLETYILSLALNYSPRYVQFILIDYKGGGMADAFRNLPHVAGIIDNLQGERVINRALASLNGEIHRRELIFKEHKVNNINDYTRQFGEVRGKELPHLVIIVDEFAELKADQPDFMRELVSASRVGRSLGIHLILSTQKPSNSVSDEIWANSRFHLCLRVQTRQDSMEMLKRPDAAYIKGMGRCFIQIGNDELFEQVQTSYSGLSYRPDEPREEEMPQLISPIGHVVRVPKKRSEDAGKKETTQMDAVLERIYQVADEHGILHSRQMWLPELPGRIGLRDLALFRRLAWDGERYANPESVAFMIGLADDVARQRYLPYIIDLTAMRNLIVVGSTGTGKTTLLQSMVYSMCSTYDPEHLHLYILSYTSQTLGNLTAFPQVGDIVFEDDVVSTKRFLNMMVEEMARRAELFAQSSTDSFTEYNSARRRGGEAPVPAIVILVDRFEQLRNMFANDEHYTKCIQRLIAEGSGRGIHLVVTAMAKNEVPSKLHSFFGGLSLQGKDRSDISDCIGMRVPYDMPPVASLAGRATGIIDGAIYEIQLALGGGRAAHDGDGFASLGDVSGFIITQRLEGDAGMTDVDRAEGIAALAREMSAAWKGKRPEAIRRIPEKPVWTDLQRLSGYEEMIRADFMVPIGYDMVQATLAGLNLETKPSWLVHGPRRSGITNYLKLMARVMRDRRAELYIIADAGWKRFARELDAPLYSTADEIFDFLNMFIKEYAGPRKPLHDAAEQQGKAAMRRQAAEFKQVCILIDNAERLYNQFSREEDGSRMRVMQALLSQIAGKKYYNFAMFMGVSAAERQAISFEPLKTVVAQGRAISLGGKLSEFDPCGVGQSLPTNIRGKAWPLGQGFVGDSGNVLQIVVPLAEEEED